MVPSDPIMRQLRVTQAEQAAGCAALKAATELVGSRGPRPRLYLPNTDFWMLQPHFYPLKRLRWRTCCHVQFPDALMFLPHCALHYKVTLFLGTISSGFMPACPTPALHLCDWVTIHFWARLHRIKCNCGIRRSSTDSHASLDICLVSDHLCVSAFMLREFC